MAGRGGAEGGYKEIVSGRQAAQIMRAPLNIGFDLRGHALILTLFPTFGLQTDCEGFMIVDLRKAGSYSD